MADKAVEAVFSVGSNCGERNNNVKEGIEWLSVILADFSTSSIYATPDCHGGQREYLNAVVRGVTHLSPQQLDRLCKKFEIDHGRDSEAREAGDVPIDIDLVVYGNEILRPKDFTREFFKIGYACI